MIENKLDGRRILVVEDEYYQAGETKAFLERAGAEVVGPTAYEEDVPALLEARNVHAAMVDINLGQGASYKVARLLQSRKLPFLFLTGYGPAAIPPDFAYVPIIEKPADEMQIVECLVRLTAFTPD